MVTLRLDRERGLRYTWSAVKRLDAEHKINLLDLRPENAEQFMRPATISVLLWGALLHEEAGLTIEQVDGWITLGALPRITQAIADAISESLKEGSQELNPPIGSPS